MVDGEKMKVIDNINAFLAEYPIMSLHPFFKGEPYQITGTFLFTAETKTYGKVSDSYELEIFIPIDYPKSLPKVFSMDNKIERKDENHVNPGDKSFCLASDLRLREFLFYNDKLNDYFKEFLVPFLYSHSIKRQSGGSLIFGELSHGIQGLIEDYKRMFSLEKEEEVRQFLKILCLKKRIANKIQCPFGCNKVLSKCSHKKIIDKYRKIAPRHYYKGIFDNKKQISFLEPLNIYR